MKTSDLIGIAFFLAFGFWWLFFPNNVIHFYTRFHSGKMKMPQTFGVRLAGTIWIALVITVAWFVFNKNH